MLCRVCGIEIPRARMLAVPHTRVCVNCLTAAGDIPKLRRFDHYDDDGELIDSNFTTDASFSHYLNRFSVMAPRNTHGENTRIADYRRSTTIPHNDTDHRSEYQESRFE